MLVLLACVGLIVLPTRPAADPSIARATQAVPPTPVLTARYRGRYILIRYRFKTWPSARDRHPYILLTSVVSADRRIPRLTKETRLKKPTGAFMQERGLGPKPFHVVYSVFSRALTRTRARSVLVR